MMMSGVGCAAEIMALTCEGAEQIQQLVIARAMSGIRIE